MFPTARALYSLHLLNTCWALSFFQVLYICSFLGTVFWGYFFSIHLLHMANFNQMLKRAIQAVTKNGVLFIVYNKCRSLMPYFLHVVYWNKFVPGELMSKCHCQHWLQCDQYSFWLYAITHKQFYEFHDTSFQWSVSASASHLSLFL